MSATNRMDGRARRGMSLLEMCISITVLVILMGSLSWAMQGMRGLVASGKERSALQTAGQLALTEILNEVRSSGFVELDGVRYPVVFSEGDPGENHPGLEHEPAEENAVEGDPDFGPDRELILLLPQDANGDRRPDLDADGNLLWSPDEISYVAVTRADGMNYLERRVNGQPGRMVARHIERIVFDTAETSGYEIPLGCVRVRLFLRKLDERGFVHRYFTEGVVSLRNS